MILLGFVAAAPAAGVALLPATERLARAGAEAVELEVQPGSACVDSATFADLVRARTDRFRPAAKGEGVRRFLVVVGGGSDGFTGTLAIDGPGGPPTRRTIRGASCNAVSAALATMVALAVDPTGEGAAGGESPGDQGAREAGALEAGAGTEAGSEAGSESESEAEGGGAVARAPTGAREPDPAPEDEPEPEREPAPLPAPDFASVGARAFSVIGPAGAPGYGGGIFLDLRWPEQGLFRPSMRLGMAGAGEQPTFTGGIGADWTWYLAQAEFCPTRAALGARLELVPCAAADGGLFQSTGTGIAPPARDVRSWLAPGVSMRLAWRASASVWTELAVGLLVPLDAYRFEVYPPSGAPVAPSGQPVQVYEMAPVEGVLALGVSFAP